MAALFAATHPERTRALVLYEAMARMSWAPDYDWALRPEERRAMLEQGWGDGSRILGMAPTAAANPRLRRWFARLERAAASPATAAQLVMMNAQVDVRAVLGQVVDLVPEHALLVVVTTRPGREEDWANRASHHRQLALRSLETTSPLAMLRALLRADHVPAGLDELLHARAGELRKPRGDDLVEAFAGRGDFELALLGDGGRDKSALFLPPRRPPPRAHQIFDLMCPLRARITSTSGLPVSGSIFLKICAVISIR